MITVICQNVQWNWNINSDMQPLCCLIECNAPVSFCSSDTIERVVLDATLVKVRLFAACRKTRSAIGLVNFCFQHVFLRRISAYSLSVAMASYLDSPFCDLHHILPGSCRSKTALDREGRSISRVCAAKLSYAERVLLANLLVFRGPSTNGDPSLGQIKTLSSFSKVTMLF